MAQILKDAEDHFGISMEEIRSGGYGDLRRVAVAWAMTRVTTTRQSKIADLTNLRSAANVSQRSKRFDELPGAALSDEELSWRRKYS